MLRKLHLIVGLAATAAVANANSNNNLPKTHTSAKDLTTKRGATLYLAQYRNTPADRTRGQFNGTWAESGTPDITTSTVSAIYSFTVTKKPDWKNIFTTRVTTIPADYVPDTYLPANEAVLTEEYQLTSLEGSALLGSLIWAANYPSLTSDTLTGVGTMVFPVSGASGVLRSAKTVAITYNADFTRDVRILKTAL